MLPIYAEQGRTKLKFKSLKQTDFNMGSDGNTIIVYQSIKQG